MPKKKKKEELDMRDEEKDPLEKEDEEDSDEEDIDPSKLKSKGFHIEDDGDLESGITDDLIGEPLDDESLDEDDEYGFGSEYDEDESW